MNGGRGKYSIIGAIGSGGMGKIYAAASEKGASVAVKVISPEFLQRGDDEAKEKAIERFFREVRAVAAIDHKNVIRMFDVGTFRETVFCAMERLNGADLGDASKRQRPSWEWLAPVMMDVCDGVQAAHDLGIMHRDLSPDNIFLSESDGQRVVKVLDFGLAKSVNGEDDGLTKTGVALGKLTYMAPEQAEKAMGKRDEYDHRVDIYALGVIMYKLLTGLPPFKGENDAQTLFMRLNVEPIRPRDVNPSIPPEIEAVILKAMARNESERYQSASALKAALKGAVAQLTTGAKPSSRIGSDDMNVSSLLDAMGRGGAQAPLLPEEASGPEMVFEAQKRKKGGALGKAAKWAAALAIAGTAAFFGYSHRGDLSHMIHDWKTKITAYQPDRQPHAAPSQAPSASASAQQEGYLVSLDSVPSGASVFEVRNGNKEYIGLTPISRRVNDGEHVFEIAKRNYLKRRVTVNPAAPNSHVVLGRAQRTQAHSESAQPEEAPAGPAQDEQDTQ